MALHTENLEQMKSLRWLLRVPAICKAVSFRTIKQTQELLTSDSSIFQDSQIQGYRLAEICNYCRIKASLILNQTAVDIYFGN